MIVTLQGYNNPVVLSKLDELNVFVHAVDNPIILSKYASPTNGGKTGRLFFRVQDFIDLVERAA